MSFWNLSDNTTAESNNTFDMGGGDFEPIPNKSQLKACITECAWSEYQGDYYINAQWEVLDGEFKGRKVFQKIRVRESDPKKRDKAIRMLAAIDANCGGGLMRLGAEPSDQDLMVNLCNKPMVIMVMVWEVDDKKGNWVSMVAPLNGAAPAPQQAPPQQQSAPQGIDSDIPF